MIDAVEYIVTKFNQDTTEIKNKRVLAVRANILGIKNNNGTIVADCRRGKAAIEGSTYCITISDSHFHCSCLAFSTSKRDQNGHKTPCKHLVFVASSVAVHIARGVK
tara:strand:+ start:1555 stop:1875 length:321 start_codon:yes stop_codon:yes gene_type:complete